MPTTRPAVTCHDPLTTASLMMSRLEQAWMPDSSDIPGIYGYIPLPLADFCALLAVARGAADPGARFIDVGCGIGTKLALAHYLGWGDVTGLEIRPVYAQVARRLCPEATVEVADATDWARYDQFDVVYSYRLFVEDEAQGRFERHVRSACRPGTLLLLPSGVGEHGERLAPHVWRL